SQRVFASAAAAGLRWLFTSEPWLVPRWVDGCRVLGRVVLKRGVSTPRVAELAAGRGWGRALALRRLKGMARRAAPPLYRLYVERSSGWGRALALRRLKGMARRAAPPLYRLYVERSVRDEE